MQNERFSRHHLLREIGTAGQYKLCHASVLLIGVGGLGSPIALYLTASGIGRIGLVDADTVSESNLQRQVLYTEKEIGLPKVRCAREHLHDLSGKTQIDIYPEFFTPGNALAISREYDVIIDGCDNYATRYLINDTCVATDKPYVYGTISEFQGQASVFNYRGGMTYRDLYPDEEALTLIPRASGGVMGVVPGIIGCIQASEVIKIVTGCGEVLRNRLFTIDLLTMNTEILDF